MGKYKQLTLKLNQYFVGDCEINLIIPRFSKYIVLDKLDKIDTEVLNKFSDAELVKVFRYYKLYALAPSKELIPKLLDFDISYLEDKKIVEDKNLLQVLKLIKAFAIYDFIFVLYLFRCTYTDKSTPFPQKFKYIEEKFKTPLSVHKRRQELYNLALTLADKYKNIINNAQTNNNNNNNNNNNEITVSDAQVTALKTAFKKYIALASVY